MDFFLNLLLNRPTGCRIVTENDHAIAAWMKIKGNLEGIFKIEIFNNPGQVGISTSNGFLAVDPAKDHRDSGKELRTVILYEIQSVIIGKQNNIKLFILKFFGIQGDQTLAEVLVLVLFRIHIFNLQVNGETAGFKYRANSFQFGIGPPVPVMIGVDIQYIFFILTCFRNPKHGHESKQQYDISHIIIILHDAFPHAGSHSASLASSTRYKMDR